MKYMICITSMDEHIIYASNVIIAQSLEDVHEYSSVMLRELAQQPDAPHGEDVKVMIYTYIQRQYPEFL